MRAYVCLTLLFIAAKVGSTPIEPGVIVGGQCGDLERSAINTPIYVDDVSIDRKTGTAKLHYGYEEGAAPPSRVAFILSKSALPEGKLYGNTRLTSIGDMRAYSAQYASDQVVANILIPASGAYYVYSAGYRCDFREEMKAGKIDWRLANKNGIPIELHNGLAYGYQAFAAKMKLNGAGGVYSEGLMIELRYQGYNDDISMVSIRGKNAMACFGSKCKENVRVADISSINSLSDVPSVLGFDAPSAFVLKKNDGVRLGRIGLWIPNLNFVDGDAIELASPQLFGDGNFMKIHLESENSEKSKMLSSIYSRSGALLWDNRSLLGLGFVSSMFSVVGDDARFFDNGISSLNGQGGTFDYLLQRTVFQNNRSRMHLGVSAGFVNDIDAVAYYDGYVRLGLKNSIESGFWEKMKSAKIKASKNVEVFYRNGSEMSALPLVANGSLDDDYNLYSLGEHVEAARKDGIWIKGAVPFHDAVVNGRNMKSFGELDYQGDYFAISYIPPGENGVASMKTEGMVGYYDHGDALYHPDIVFTKSGKKICSTTRDEENILLDGNASLFQFVSLGLNGEWGNANVKLKGQGDKWYNPVRILNNMKLSRMKDFTYFGNYSDLDGKQLRTAFVYEENGEPQVYVPYNYTVRNSTTQVFYSNDWSLRDEMKKIGYKFGSQLRSNGGYVEEYDLSLMKNAYFRMKPNTIESLVDVCFSVANGYPHFVNIYENGDLLQDNTAATKVLPVDAYVFAVVGVQDGIERGKLNVLKKRPNGAVGYGIVDRSIPEFSGDIDASASAIIAAGLKSKNVNSDNIGWSSYPNFSISEILGDLEMSSVGEPRGELGSAVKREPVVDAKILSVKDVASMNPCNDSRKWVGNLYKSKKPTQLILAGKDGYTNLQVVLTKECDICDVYFGYHKLSQVNASTYVLRVKPFSGELPISDGKTEYLLPRDANANVVLKNSKTGDVVDILKTNNGTPISLYVVGRDAWESADEFLRLAFAGQTLTTYISQIKTPDMKLTYRSISSLYYSVLKGGSIDPIYGAPIQSTGVVDVLAEDRVTHPLGYAPDENCIDRNVRLFTWDKMSVPSKLLGKFQYGWDSFIMIKLKESGVLKLIYEDVIANPGIVKTRKIDAATISGSPDLDFWKSEHHVYAQFYPAPFASNLDAFGAVGQCTISQPNDAKNGVSAVFDAGRNEIKFSFDIDLGVDDLWDFEYGSSPSLLTEAAAVVQSGLNGFYSSGSPMLNHYDLRYVHEVNTNRVQVASILGLSN